MGGKHLVRRLLKLRPMRSIMLPLMLLVLPTGCVHRALIEFNAEPTAEESPAPPGEVRQVEVASDEPVEEAPHAIVATPPATHGLVPADPPLFRLGAGYGALGQVDLTPCREQGLPAGYLHMRVTFRHSGRIVHAAVESPVPPPNEALACISEQLELAMVPIFVGDDVTLSKSFFVN
jgi:hypothetical protein